MARKKEPKKTGRPPVPITAKTLRGLGRLQPTLDEVASVFGCTKRTVQHHLKANPELAQALEDGKNAGRLNLRRTQLRHAEGTGSGAVNMAIHLGKHWLGQTDKSLVEMTGKNGGPIQTFDYSKLSDDQLAQFETFLTAIAVSNGNAGGNQGGTPPAAG
jgi:hypothetical protein